MAHEWSNWSGTIRFAPERYEAPSTEEQVTALVREAVDRGLTIRPVGMGHSSSPLVQTPDILVSLEKFTGVKNYDTEKATAIVGAGWRLREAGMALKEVGLSMENFGDIDMQAVAGAFGTGTHGSGKHINNLSYHLIGVRLVTGTGEIAEFDVESDPEFIKAARVSLGALGIFTQIKLRLRPELKVIRRYWCTHVDECLEYLPKLTEENRSFDFYWYPRSDLVQLRTLTEADREPVTTPHAVLRNEAVGSISEAIPRQRELRYHEMEYALSMENGPECFREVRERIKKHHRKMTGWRVLYRTVGGDDTYLSPAYGRDTVTITLHQNGTLPYEEYFADMEPVFKSYGGRPHWGKKHSMLYPELSSVYPKFEDFLRIRERMDPHGVFLNDHLRDIFGLGSPFDMNAEAVVASQEGTRI